MDGRVIAALDMHPGCVASAEGLVERPMTTRRSVLGYLEPANRISQTPTYSAAPSSKWRWRGKAIISAHVRVEPLEAKLEESGRSGQWRTRRYGPLPLSARAGPTASGGLARHGDSMILPRRHAVPGRGHGPAPGRTNRSRHIASAVGLGTMTARSSPSASNVGWETDGVPVEPVAIQG